MKTMKYEFMEVLGSWMLMLNDLPCRTYSKKMYSKQEAETLAAEEVKRAIKRYGVHTVSYNGLYTVA